MSRRPSASRRAPTTTVVNLFEGNTQAAILSSVLAAERVRFPELRATDRPGTYVIGAVRSTRALRQYKDLVTSGQFPLYVGSARSLSERLDRHRITIASATGLAISDFWITYLETDSLASALGTEAELIAEIRPPWNQRSMSGFGSRHPGKNRMDQRPTGFDVLHRRDWANSASEDEEKAVRRSLRLYLESGFVRPLWPVFEPGSNEKVA